MKSWKKARERQPFDHDWVLTEPKPNKKRKVVWWLAAWRVVSG